MKAHLISMFIDDELDLDEKVEFVETVHVNRGFKDETVDLLGQEKLLRGDMVGRVPAPRLEVPKKTAPAWWRPLAALSAALAMVAVFFFLVPHPATRIQQVAAEGLLPGMDTSLRFLWANAGQMWAYQVSGMVVERKI